MKRRPGPALKVLLALAMTFVGGCTLNGSAQNGPTSLLGQGTPVSPQALAGAQQGFNAVVNDSLPGSVNTTGTTPGLGNAVGAAAGFVAAAVFPVTVGPAQSAAAAVRQ